MQTDVKRMLAYSSINHAGFILVGVRGGVRPRASQAALFYLAAYTFMVAGTFGVVTLVGPARATATTPSTTTGPGARASRCWRSRFTVFLLAQAGVPFTSGFFAKFYVIGAAVEAGSFWLALIAMLSAVISAFLYLRIVVTMYMGDDEESAPVGDPGRRAGRGRHRAGRLPGRHHRGRGLAGAAHRGCARRSSGALRVAVTT